MIKVDRHLKEGRAKKKKKKNEQKSIIHGRIAPLSVACQYIINQSPERNLRPFL